MSSAAFSPNGVPDQSLPEDAAAPAERVPEPALLERVLHETQAATDADAPLEPAQWEALRAVARQSGEQPLTQPLVVALVQAVLLTRFGALAQQPALWQTLAQRIAETLWEDPPSQARLQRLWSRLTEAER